jgi:hypothetical protein
MRQFSAPLAGINLQYGLTSHRAEQIKTLETEDVLGVERCYRCQPFLRTSHLRPVPALGDRFTVHLVPVAAIQKLQLLRCARMTAFGKRHSPFRGGANVGNGLNPILRGDEWQVRPA